MALYHKYRPQKFNDIVGQEHIKKTLMNAVSQKRISHAYIFSGPRGVGKTSFARILAKVINCSQRKGSEPCDECLSCREIREDRSLDVIEIDAASNRGIDEIRELREKIGFAPAHGKNKVYIIDEVHMLTKEAFNALLKTLEEPPSHATFIMATTEVHRVPETIISRTQSFDFKRASLEEIVHYLQKVSKAEKINIDSETLKLIAQSASGSYRDALSSLDQISSLGAKKISLQDVEDLLGLVSQETLEIFIDHLQKKNAALAVELINKIYEQGYDLGRFNEQIIEELRKKMVGSGDFSVLNLIEKFLQAKKESKYTNLPQLPLEIAVVEICGFSDDSDDRKEKKDLPAKAVKAYFRKEESSSKVSPKPRAETVPTVLSFADIKNQWPLALKRIGEENHSLMIILSEAELKSINGQTIQIALGNKFYAERLKDPKKYQKITDILSEIYHQNIALECSVETSKSEKLINDALDVFGSNNN